MASSSGTKRDRGRSPSPSRMMSRAPFLANPNEDNNIDDSERMRPSRRMSEDNSIFDCEVVPSSLASIAPILRVAFEIEKDNPRVAYLCRFCAFEKAQKLDPNSSGRGVHQFKIYLLHRLEMEQEQTRPQLARDDVSEIQRYYQSYWDRSKDGQYTEKPEELAKIFRTATVLYDVLSTVVPAARVDYLSVKYAEDVTRMQYEPYNILPPFSCRFKQDIMELPEIKAAFCAVRNVEGLPMPSAYMKANVTPDDVPQKGFKPVNDIFDWLSSLFGFQKGNVANQKEHLILLLANSDVRRKPNLEDYGELNNETIRRLVNKIFKNYHSWCNYLQCRSHLRFVQGCNRQQLELIYISLYLLIWGEASNIRSMPECICYIFHNMANEVYGVLFHNMRSMSGSTYQFDVPDDESFLKNVITPIYAVLKRESKRNKGGNASHSKWRNYDDLNEYFWSRKCFQLKWPMDMKADFFEHLDKIPAHGRNPKSNFVEVRTFWHLYRSFDRMWIFFIGAFQAMLIVAWESGSLMGFLDKVVFGSVLSVFITFSFLELLKAMLDIVLTLNAWRSLKFSHIMRYLLKFALAAVWAVILPRAYWNNQSFYNHLVVVYLIPNVLAGVLYLLPSLRKSMELSDWRIVTLVMWWDQPKLPMGRGMQEDTSSLLKYSLFWILLLISKLAFSYYVEILPLIRPTKMIMGLHLDDYQWQNFFSDVTHHIGVIIAIWAPIVLVYFMDVQIWYALFSSLFGGIHGAFSHLGEIQTFGMLSSRFQSLPSAFARCLVPFTDQDKREHMAGIVRKKIAVFSYVWNEFIYSMRKEDLISNRDRDLLLVPYYASEVTVIQWPHLFLAGKVQIALDKAAYFIGKDDSFLFRMIMADHYTYSAVIECYQTLRNMIYSLLRDYEDRRIVMLIFSEVETSIQQKMFLYKFRMGGLPSLVRKLERFLSILLSVDEDDGTYRIGVIVNILQDIMEIIICDIMVNGREEIERDQRHRASNFEQRYTDIDIGVTKDKQWIEKVRRLFLLLTAKESAIDVIPNMEARRRILFFTNSLFMKMPTAPKVRHMISFSVLTPCYKDVTYSLEDPYKESEDGMSNLFYLQKLYPDEWLNFLERVKEMNDGELRKWVSYRGQSLSRTVRGMMYYKEALELQSWLEFSDDSALLGPLQTAKKDKGFLRHADAVANIKFTYVISCPVYGALKKSADPRDRSCYYNILNLLITYPLLRVAYIDEREEMPSGGSQKIYYSVLVKGGEQLDEEIYRIKLPGPPTEIGEGKPEAQNLAIIFTRGEALQTIDVNQDYYFEEAYKMRNVLEEFLTDKRKPSILGLREHIFTGSASSIAGFISNQRTSFATIEQRILANPLRVRFHYGHNDIFDRIFHITRGGISKASKNINMNDGLFSGFNSILHGGYVTHHDYIQVGKGYTVGMNQLSSLEARVACANGEQTISRDVYRLGQQFDFCRMLSFYFTTVGFYFSSVVAVLAVYVFLYGHVYIVMNGLERDISEQRINQSTCLEEALATVSLYQLGLALLLPMIMETALEKEILTAVVDFIVMHLQLACVLFMFQLGTKAHYYAITLLHGVPKYLGTGAGFVFRANFADNYRLYSRSHFVKGWELVILLVVYEAYREPYLNSWCNVHGFIIFSIWLLAFSWLFSPFIFNPHGFDWQKTLDDWIDWKRWMGNRGVIGIPPVKSWESWWFEQQLQLKYTNIRGMVIELILASRFFFYQYGIVYHLDIAHHSNSFLVYVLSWAVLIAVFLMLKIVSMDGKNFGTCFELSFGIVKALMIFVSIAIITYLFLVHGLTISDLLAALLAFLPTGWAILCIGQALQHRLVALGFMDSLMELAWAYDNIMGLVLFVPIAILSWLPLVSELQNGLLFFPAFSRGLQLSWVLAEMREKHD